MLYLRVRKELRLIIHKKFICFAKDAAEIKKEKSLKMHLKA